MQVTVKLAERRTVVPARAAVGGGEQEAITRGWLRLAVGSLAVAGAFAVLVAIARSPGVQQIVGERYFRIALVGHVTFSLSVWTMSCAALLWWLVADRAALRLDRRLASVSLWTAAAGASTAAVSSVLGIGLPVLVDYIPVLTHPLFMLGLAAFFAGISLAAVNFLIAAHDVPTLHVEVQAMRIAAIVYLAGVLTAVLAFSAGWQHDWAMFAWGPGHLMQLVNMAGLLVAWILLLGREPSPAASAGMRASLPLLLLPAVVVPLLSALPGVPHRTAMGTVTWSALLVPGVVAWFTIAGAAARAWRSGGSIPLVVSMTLFAVGVVAALFGLHGDTRVTAHYHATVGSVTVAYMGLAARVLPAAGRQVWMRHVARLQPALYGGGLLLLIAGLFWASSYGGQRKVFETFAEHSPFFGPTLLFVGGAVLAILGGIAFVLGLGIPLLRSSRTVMLPKLARRSRADDTPQAP